MYRVEMWSEEGAWKETDKTHCQFVKKIYILRLPTCSTRALLKIMLEFERDSRRGKAFTPVK
jgi:hypothetical protein